MSSTLGARLRTVGPATAAWALQLGRLTAGQTVLITGAAGGVGVAAVQLAAKRGARVLGTGTRPDSLEKLRAYGLNDAIVVGEQDANEQVRALLGGEGVDLLIDNVGGPALVEEVLQMVKAGDLQVPIDAVYPFAEAAEAHRVRKPVGVSDAC